MYFIKNKNKSLISKHTDGHRRKKVNTIHIRCITTHDSNYWVTMEPGSPGLTGGDPQTQWEGLSRHLVSDT